MLKAAMYYVVACLITFITSCVFNSNYAHGPALYHIVGFIFIIGGLIQLVFAFASLFSEQKAWGKVVVHMAILTSIVVWFSISISREDTPQVSLEHEEITITQDSVVPIIRNGTDTLYARRGDSIIVDKLDSTK